MLLRSRLTWRVAVTFVCMIEAASETEALASLIGQEELIGLAQAARCLPKIDGKKVSVCTI